MPRIRTIKPDFFTSLTVTQLSVSARLTFVGLWTHVDDDGRCVDEPRLIAAALWPLDDNVGAATVDGHLTDMAQVGLIVRYRVGGKAFLQVCGWEEHQKINRPKPSKIPPPDQADEPSLNNHGHVSDDSLGERKGKEQGKEQEASLRDAETVQRFEEHFWSVYPPTNGVKRDKQAALREWMKLTIEDQRAAVIGARNKRHHFEQTGEQPPYAVRFLRRRDFEDFLEAPTFDRDGNVRPLRVPSCPDCNQALAEHDDDTCELVKDLA